MPASGIPYYFSIYDMGYKKQPYVPDVFHEDPDGEKCIKKIGYLAKRAAVISVYVSSIDYLLISRVVGYGPAIARIFTVSGPIIGAAVVFGGTTCMLARFREKDDMKNYFVGGFAAGSLFGAARKSLKVGLYASAIFAGVGMLNKYGYMNGITFWPQEGRLENYEEIHMLKGWSTNHYQTKTNE